LISFCNSNGNNPQQNGDTEEKNRNLFKKEKHLQVAAEEPGIAHEQERNNTKYPADISKEVKFSHNKKSRLVAGQVIISFL